jgi:hypothetical protein
MHHIQIAHDSSPTRSPRRRCDFLSGKKAFGIDEVGNEVQKKKHHFKIYHHGHVYM